MQYTSNSSSYTSSNYTSGFADLYTYGSWFNVIGYGYGWRPYGVGLGWCPFSSGGWFLDAGFGWGFIGNQPWGWLPLLTTAVDLPTRFPVGFGFPAILATPASIAQCRR